MKERATRWYGGGLAATDRPADFHEDAAAWDNPMRHRQLLEQLMQDYDGWAIATTPDGVICYEPLPPACRLMAWVKPNATPGSHRIGSYFEVVIVYPAHGRRSSRGPGQISNVLTCPAPRLGFSGAKPTAWTEWVLNALLYDPVHDKLDDLFPGSGAVSSVVAERRRVVDVELI